MRSVLVLTAIVIFTLTFSASADFRYVGTIRAPVSGDILAYVSGLEYYPEYEQEMGGLFVAVDRVDSSQIFMVDPNDGTIYMESTFLKHPPDCPDDSSRLVSCAVAPGYDYEYWAGDQCGDIIRFTWYPPFIYVGESFVLEPNIFPAGMTARGDTLYIFDALACRIVVYWIGGSAVDRYIPLGGDLLFNGYGMTIYRGHFFVSSEGDSGIVIREFGADGDAIDIHRITSPNCNVGTGMTFVGDRLYFSAYPDSIEIYEMVTYNTDVPDGDDVVVEGVPDHLEVTFDSVSASGTLTVDVSGTQACPPPLGVTLLPDFYDMSTTASFDYAAEVALEDSVDLPGTQLKQVRVFTRPSGECQTWRDITVGDDGPLTFSILTRARSEDDEFSVFALAVDERPPRAVARLKFDQLGNSIEAGQDSIPQNVLEKITALLGHAREAYCRGRSDQAALLADSIATVVRSTPAIPHTYSDYRPHANIAGDVISRAHTLSFSLRYSATEAVHTTAAFVPDPVNLGNGRWARAFIEVPQGFFATEVDSYCIFLDHAVSAAPDSVLAVDYDSDGAEEIRALFPMREVKAHLPVGQSQVEITCFVGGYELHADAVLHILRVAPVVLGSGPVYAGTIQRVAWEGSGCEPGVPASVWLSLDGGIGWQPIAADLSQRFYDWTAPNVETSHGVLKVVCTSATGSAVTLTSDEFVITSASTGVEVAGKLSDRLLVSPNPSGSSFAIEFVGGGVATEVGIYSVRGELVKVLRGESNADGRCVLVWDGDNHDGETVSPGTYFVVVRQAGDTAVRKVVLGR